jgi:sulfate transport system ATP-binding protein
MSIVVSKVSKTFGKHVALKDIDLEIPSGSLTALLGPSGSGKTTLLRIIAGLEAADMGNVTLEGEDFSEIPLQRRQIGFVFQHYALFRHMTVFDNIGFALKMRKRPNAEIKDRVMELLRLIQLEGIENRYPSQLSGGQRQRVALARALSARPKVLLLDEPFGALDARVRKELRAWLRRLHDEIHVTSVFVTHDQEEALELADRVVVMSKGRIEQVGTPDEVYHQPANPFVMTFLGQVNLFHGRWDDAIAEGQSNGSEIAAEMVAYVRPHQLDLTRQPNGTGAHWPGKIIRIHNAGVQVRLDLEMLPDNRPAEVLLPRERFVELGPTVGESIFVRPKEMKIFPKEMEQDYAI